MSNPLAIAAVTCTLRNLLARVATPWAGETDTDLSDTQVTTLPPDKAGLTEDHNQINLFLFQLHPNAESRNRDNQGKVGGLPALALDLFYMLTAYGRNSDEILSQRLLGRAMSLFHSYPVLSATDIAAALPGTDLQNQTDRLRINPHSIPDEEITRIWTNFQVKYRLSVVYRVSVVLIDHERSQPAAPAVQTIQVGVTAPTRDGAS